MKPMVFLLAVLLCGCSQSNRYSVHTVQYGTMHYTIKLDTKSGQTWLFDDAKEKWTPITD